MACEPEPANPSGVVFNIQRFSLHDGPGIRTTVFLKGCPLNCLWCANPESKRPTPEISLRASLCIGCKRCRDVCPREAVDHSETVCRIDFERCDDCGACAAVCPSGALRLIGAAMTVCEVMDEVRRDISFYRRTQGGLTLSGGEPLLQPEFSATLLAEAKRRYIHTALDTSGFSSWEILADVSRHADLVLYDLKHIDADEHRAGTGKPNDRILENLRLLTEKTKLPVWIRYPLIPEYNDSEESVAAATRFIQSLPRTVEKVSILPYHDFWAAKNKRGDFQKAEIPLPSSEMVRNCAALFERSGVTTEIGR